MNRDVSIIVIESSPIITEGLASILNKSVLNCQIVFVDSLENIELIFAKKNCELIFINPSFLLNNLKTFNAIKNRLSKIKWIGLIYTHYDPKLLSLLDASITISDTRESIINIVNKLLADENQNGQSLSQDILTEREIDVLKLVAAGTTNKEIANKLFISTHTVITHRKNISQKTGIKSISGLTIYAVVQKFVSIETLTE
jgi:DNA-binding NarL/FixJ family response regulator